MSRHHPPPPLRMPLTIVEKLADMRARADDHASQLVTVAQQVQQVQESGGGGAAPDPGDLTLYFNNGLI